MGNGIGIWVKEQLVGAGNRGVTASGLFVELKEFEKTNEFWERGFVRKKGRQHSWARFFLRFKEMGYITPTGKTREAYQKGGEIALLVPSRYYRITAEGKMAPLEAWSNPLAWQYPAWGPSGERMKEYQRQWRAKRRRYPRRGRPSKMLLEVEAGEEEEEEE